MIIFSRRSAPLLACLLSFFLSWGTTFPPYMPVCLSVWLAGCLHRFIALRRYRPSMYVCTAAYQARARSSFPLQGWKCNSPSLPYKPLRARMLSPRALLVILLPDPFASKGIMNVLAPPRSLLSLSIAFRMEGGVVRMMDLIRGGRGAVSSGVGHDGLARS